MQPRPTVLLLIAVASSNASAKKTRHDGKPPGWRPDLPKENAGEIVSRMLRRLQRHRVKPGKFFKAYEASLHAMSDAQAALRPATLKSASDTTVVDDEMRAKLKASEVAFQWQAAQVDLLEGVAQDDEVTHWPTEDVERFLVRAKVVDSAADLSPLPSASVVKLAEDLAGVLRVFQYTFANMPDDEEAKEISMADNLRDGFPPPSQAPLMPPAPAPQREKKPGQKRARAKRPRDEL